MLLQDALVIAEEASDPWLLQHLSDARRSMRRWSEQNRTIQVDLLAGRVTVHGQRVPLSKAEFALVAALSLSERGVAREVLAEDLYPNVDPARAANATKVYVHRVRRRVGSREVIRCDDGRYVLGNAVDVEVFRLEAEVRRLQREGGAHSAEVRERLERLQRRLSDGRPQFMLEWVWFEETERRLCELTRNVTLLLANDALRSGDHERAIALAYDLAHDDPLDEAAPELAIRACLSTGNRAAAMLEYRRYDGIVKREIGAAPSQHLRALVDNVALMS